MIGVGASLSEWLRLYRSRRRSAASRPGPRSRPIRRAAARCPKGRSASKRRRRLGGAERDRGFRLRRSLRDRQPRVLDRREPSTLGVRSPRGARSLREVTERRSLAPREPERSERSGGWSSPFGRAKRRCARGADRERSEGDGLVELNGIEPSASLNIGRKGLPGCEGCVTIGCTARRSGWPRRVWRATSRPTGIGVLPSGELGGI